MSAGCSRTCGICGVVVETPARDLVINGVLLSEGCVIDLAQNNRDFEAHYAAEHPGEVAPESIW